MRILVAESIAAEGIARLRAEHEVDERLGLDPAALREMIAGYDALSDLDLIAPSELARLGARMEDADIEWGLLARIIWK